MTSTDKIYGLVLSGGKSTRMGKDKGLIDYHGIPQREHLYHLLQEVCEKTFMSIRKEQAPEFSNTVETIVDENVFRGPFNGILSAHNQYPEVAWLVLACDLPLMDVQAIKELIANRKKEHTATAFAQKENPLPEPLCAIWEPHALQKVAHYLESGNGTCPRKFLIRNDAHLVIPENTQVLLNANSEEEYKEAMALLDLT